MMKTAWCLIAALLLCVAGSGCRKAADKMAERAMEKALEKEGIMADLNSKDQKVSITTEKGEKMEWGGGEKGIEIPKDFPQDVYVPPGARAVGSMSSPEGHTLSLKTAEKMDKVAPSCKEFMTKAGWKEEAAMSAPGMTSLVYSRENRTVTISIGGEEKQTEIIILERVEKK